MYLEERKCKTYCIGESFILKRPKGREGGGRKRKKNKRCLFFFFFFFGETYLSAGGSRQGPKKRRGDGFTIPHCAKKCPEKEEKVHFAAVYLGKEYYIRRRNIGRTDPARK